LELWIGALERINQAGVKRLGAIHRGFSSYDKKIYRNLPMWQIPIELHRRIPELPIICDPSHIGGRRELIAPLCQQAMDLGFDGLIIESHCDPDKAWSDAKQQLTPADLKEMLDKLVVRKVAPEQASLDSLNELRYQIDQMDHELIDLLRKRMDVCIKIGEYKKANNMTVYQPTRWDTILNKYAAMARERKLDEQFIGQVFTAIHDASVNLQTKVFNGTI
jgi:chorismate mutase